MPTMRPPIADLHDGPSRKRGLFYAGIILLAANLGALVDLFLHPGIAYFDNEHIIVGLVTALVLAGLIAMLELYLARLYAAIGRINRLESFLAICSGCQKVRIPDPEHLKPDTWIPLEQYIRNYTSTTLSHGLCPDCMERLYGSYTKESRKEKAESTGG